MKAQTSLAAIFAMAATFCSAARADDMNWIYLQFGGVLSTQENGSVLGNPAGSWNFHPGSFTVGSIALNDVTGATSGASASWDAPGYIATQAPVPLGTANSGQYGPLLNSYIYEPAGALGTITLTGLNAGAEYTLNLFTQPDANGPGREVNFTVAGGTSQSVVTGPSSATQSTFQLGVNYETLDVYASSGGRITIYYQGVGAGNEADINGLQLRETAAAPSSATPEPGTVSMMLGGVLLCLGAARRKSRAA